MIKCLSGEKDKADKLKNVDDKARSVGAWILWEKMKKALRLPESAVFNLSHSGKYVLCACSDHEDVQTGCDVEMKGKLRMPVAERYFCREECEIIRNGKDEKNRQVVLPLLGIKRKLYESNQKRNGPGHAHI